MAFDECRDFAAFQDLLLDRHGFRPNAGRGPGDNASQDRERRLPALVPESQHDDALVLRWWICTNVGEIQIQGNECTSFMSADANDFLVTSSAQALIVDRYGVVTVAPQ